MFIDSQGDVEGNYTVLALKDDPKAYYSQRKSLAPVGFFRSSADDIPVSAASSTIRRQLVAFL